MPGKHPTLKVTFQMVMMVQFIFVISSHFNFPKLVTKQRPMCTCVCDSEDTGLFLALEKIISGDIKLQMLLI